MKLYKYIPMLLLASFASCEIERLPVSYVSEDGYYSSGDDVQTGLVACYNGLQEPMEYEWELTELRSDNTRVRQITSTSTSTIRQLEFDKCDVTTTNDSVYDYWYATYNNIARCNVILNYLSVVEDADEAAEIEGQARFIRAYHYFNLVRLYGPVFLVDAPLQAADAVNLPRTSIPEMYEFIIEDLEIAASSLEGIVWDDTEKARVTEWTAKALLGKVYMTLQDYSTAKSYLSDVYNNSGHALEANYEDVFSITNECNNEILFTIRYTSGNIGQGNPFGNRFGPLNSGDYVIANDGDGLNYPTQIIVDAYDTLESSYTDDDGNTVSAVYEPRREVCFCTGYYDPSDTDDYWTGMRFINKYMSPVTIDEDGDKDWPILRFADVILIYAEALNELEGPSSTVISLLNEVRTRAQVDPITAADVPTTHLMRMALEDERQKELAFENHRWFDLVRTGRVLEVVNQGFIDEIYYNDIAIEDGLDIQIEEVVENDILLPIPQAEIDVNPNVTQNAGY